jgi:hypothetical protein
MAEMTEAACLLQNGAIYGTRLMLQPATGDPVFAGFKHGAFSIYFGDAPIVHFDLEGRWQRAYFDGLHYLKGLDTSVQTIDRVREGENLVLKRRTLGFADASDFDARMRSTALELAASLDLGRFHRVEPPAGSRPLSNDELRAFLERVARWDAAAWFAHRERYLDAYGPLPFLPPDCLQAVVLQATLGHAGGVSFGGTATAEHYIRSPDEFETHARAVSGLLGRRLAQCKYVFLAGSDVLLQPEGEVTAYVGTVSRVFPIDPSRGNRRPDPSPDAPHVLTGIHAFIDRFGVPRPDREALRRWQSLGLTRVTLGVESGDTAVRTLYGKTWSNSDLAAAVADLKAAGIGVGLIALVGAGGREHAEAHVSATADLLNALELGPGDLVSLVDASELRSFGAAADTPVGSPPFTPLTPTETSAQLDDLKRLLTPIRAERKAKVAPYSLEKQGVA